MGGAAKTEHRVDTLCTPSGRHVVDIAEGVRHLFCANSVKKWWSIFDDTTATPAAVNSHKSGERLEAFQGKLASFFLEFMT